MTGSYTRNVMTKIRFYVYKKEKQSKIENFNSLGMIIYWIELMSLSHPNMNGEKRKERKEKKNTRKLWKWKVIAMTITWVHKRGKLIWIDNF